MILKSAMVFYMVCGFVNQMVSDELVCRFTHASDLHIGKYQYTNPTRAMDYINALIRLLETVHQSSSDFLLLGGDIFNSIDLLPFYFTQVVEVLRKFHERTKKRIPILAIEGNHDIRSFSRGRKISPNLSWVKVLSDLGLITLLNNLLEDPDRKKEPIKIKGVKIFGNSYCGEKIDPILFQFTKNISFYNGFNILLNHVGIEGQMEGIPGQDKEILDHTLKSHINYLGLGHFHRQYILDQWIFNPGCLSPACISDFSLPHGYFIINVIKNDNCTIKIERKQVPERPVIWHKVFFRTTPKSKQVLIASIVKHVGNILPINYGNVNPCDITVPILCLSIRSPSPKLLSAATKKELCDLLIQRFAIVECNIVENQIIFKPLDGFFQDINYSFAEQ